MKVMIPPSAPSPTITRAFAGRAESGLELALEAFNGIAEAPRLPMATITAVGGGLGLREVGIDALSTTAREPMGSSHWILLPPLPPTPCVTRLLGRRRRTDRRQGI